jgi:predicted dinucleotide-binding enzyme
MQSTGVAQTKRSNEERHMRMGVLGTGMVGRTIAGKLVSLGHEVRMGSRSADNENAAGWVASVGADASQGTFAEAAAFSELNFNCTAGDGSLDALRSAGAANLAGKVLVDVANTLDFSHGRPPSLLITTTESLGEQIQDAFPEARVVKTLNTMNCEVMVDPARVPGEHDVFVSGNDNAAKAEVAGLLQSFGWPAEHIIDLGDITTARGPELYVPLWIRLHGFVGTGDFNIKVVR